MTPLKKCLCDSAKAVFRGNVRTLNGYTRQKLKIKYFLQFTLICTNGASKTQRKMIKVKAKNKQTKINEMENTQAKEKFIKNY